MLQRGGVEDDIGPALRKEVAPASCSERSPTPPVGQRTKYLVNDRLCFMRFLGLGVLTACRVPRRSGWSGNG